MIFWFLLDPYEGRCAILRTEKFRERPGGKAMPLPFLYFSAKPVLGSLLNEPDGRYGPHPHVGAVGSAHPSCPVFHPQLSEKG
ncbi:unnamed protein product [Ectocarpus sp. 6 AP-2014]